MPFEIIRNDITKLKVHAVVNAANSQLQQGGGVCGAVFSAAGADKLKKACDKIGYCNTGDAVITKGYNLLARYIIHTVGPVWHGGAYGEREQLYNCYRNSLILAQKNNCKTVAFPLISSGIYGYPKDKALQAAISSIGDFLLENDMTVYLVVYDKSSFTLSEKLFSSISEFIDDCYVDKHFDSGNRSRIFHELQMKESISIEEASDEENVSNYMQAPSNQMPAANKKSKKKKSLDDILARLDETFSQSLLRLIDEKNCRDSDVYKKANIDRKLFSKIRCNTDYKPSKNTALALSVALELNLDETKDLLRKAGYALSRSSKSDVIVEYFIGEGIYNIFEINEALFAFDQSLLGA